MGGVAGLEFVEVPEAESIEVLVDAEFVAAGGLGRGLGDGLAPGEGFVEEFVGRDDFVDEPGLEGGFGVENGVREEPAFVVAEADGEGEEGGRRGRRRER